MYRKLNTYLLENHPNLWHVRLPLLVLSGLVLHIIAFVYGWMYLTPTVLTKYYTPFVDSYFILLQSILIIIVLFVWALLFFRNSALNLFYRANRFYSIKLFSIIAILFTWNLSSFLTFEWAVALKKDRLYEQIDIVSLQKEKDFLEPLLLRDKESYYFANNPKLTQQGIQFEEINSNKTRIGYCFSDSIKKMKNSNLVSECYMTVEDIDSTKISKVDSLQGVFFQLENITINKYCSFQGIRQMMKIDGFHLYELKNHYYYSEELDLQLKEAKYDALAERLTKFKERINAIYPFTNFNPYVNLSYIVAKKGLYLEQIVQNDSYGRRVFSSYSLNKIDTSEQLEIDLSKGKEYFYFDEYEYDNLFSNVTKETNYYSTTIVLICFSILLAYLLVQFQFIQFINFVIAVPISLALIIAGVFFGIVTFELFDSFTPFVYLFILLLVVGVPLLIYSRLSERIKEVLIVLAGVILPATILSFYAALGERIYRKIEHTCDLENSSMPQAYFKAPPYYEWHFIVLGVLVIFICLFLIKRLKAKPE